MEDGANPEPHLGGAKPKPGRPTGGPDDEQERAQAEPIGEVSATGVVVEHRIRRPPGGPDDLFVYVVHPVVRFQTRDGASIVEFESANGSNAPPWVGEEVTVLYDALQPGNARLVPGSTAETRPNTFAAAGVLALLVTALLVLILILAVLLVALT